MSTYTRSVIRAPPREVLYDEGMQRL